MGKVDIGRIGENIVTNELLARGFLVTHLDKGTRGVSSNADLLVGHEKLSKPILIQVKSCVSLQLKWVFLGGFPAKVLDGEGSLFNSKPGFHADFIATVSIRSATEYRVFLIPVKLAENVLLAAYKGWHKIPTKQNNARKPVPTMYVSVRPKLELSNSAKRSFFSTVSEVILRHEDAFHLLLGKGAKVGEPASLLEREAPTAKELAAALAEE